MVIVTVVNRAKDEKRTRSNKLNKQPGSKKRKSQTFADGQRMRRVSGMLLAAESDMIIMVRAG
jgi:hypothetical protein